MPYSLLLEQIRSRPFAVQTLAEPVAVSELPTPALLLDETVFSDNLAKMASFLANKGKGFRPHCKTHKCPIIAEKQFQAGAVGVCAAKLSEAVALVHAGISGILITSAVMSPAKAVLLGELTRLADVDIVVDSLIGLEVIRDGLPDDAHLGVLLDVDIEMGRTGSRSLDTLLVLAERVVADDRMSYRGIQHYAGHLMHVEGYAARRDKSLAAWERVSLLLESMKQRGFSAQVVTGCGTGTYNIDCEVAEVTDLQVGSYIFMDQEYRLIGGERGGLFEDFDVSLSVATTAISQPQEGAITVDGGYKAFASDTVNPEPLDCADSKYRFAGDEHGILILGAGSQEPLLGSLQRFVTPHCDPTVNLYDGYWVHNDGLVHSRWPITARGCSW